MRKRRVAVITGGSSGIGRAISQRFAVDGDDVVIIGRNRDRLASVGTEFGVAWMNADVRDRGQVERVVSRIVEDHGPVDVLVNNAGLIEFIAEDVPLGEAERIWDTVVDVNLKGAFLMTRCLTPHLRRPGGRVINITSLAAYSGGMEPGAVAYASAKAGLIGLTYSQARELGPLGITANAVAYGLIAGTGITQEWPLERVRFVADQTPLGRPGSLSEAASVVHYLATLEAGFINGEVLHVNGGWLFGR